MRNVLQTLHMTNKIDLIDWDLLQWTQPFQEAIINDSKYNLHGK